MERWDGRVALVTGASVGIGAAVARALVQHGMKVVGCARSVEKVEVSRYLSHYVASNGCTVTAHIYGILGQQSSLYLGWFQGVSAEVADACRLIW